MMLLRALALLLALSGSALAQSGQIPSGRVWGNSGASKAIASPATFTAMFDRALGSTTGAVIARSAATWGLVSGTTTQLLHGSAAGSPSFGALVAADVTTNTLTNATLAQAAAWTLKGNATAGTANVTDFTVTGLTSKATPVGADELLLSDSAASNAFKKATVTGLSGTILSGAVTSLNGQTGALTGPVRPQGRLTLQTLTPVMSTTQSAKTTIYYTAYQGNQIPIYDGTNMISTPITGGEISVATTDTTKSAAAIGASKVNDWFVWNDAGTIRIGHGPDWTSDTARSAGTALVMVNGILLNNASITNGPAASRGTYVGTTRSNGSSQLDWIFGASAAGGTAAFLGVWNAYNRASVTTTVTDSNATWATTTSTTPAALDTGGTGSGLNNRISAVFGLAEDGISVSIFARLEPAAVVNAFGRIGFLLNGTTNFDKTALVSTTTAIVWNGVGAHVSNAYAPQLGFAFWQATQSGDGTNTCTIVGAAEEGLSATLRM